METKKKSVLDLENAYAAGKDCVLCAICVISPSPDIELAILFELFS